MAPASSAREFRNSLDVVRDAFALLVTGAHPVQIDGRLFSHLPDRPLALDELRDRLLARSCPQTTRDEVWAYLVRRSRDEGTTWTVGAAGVALPALTAIAATLSARFVSDPSDITAEVLTGFLAALTSVDLDRPRIMLRLRWAAYRSGHEALMQALAGPIPVDPAGLPVQPLTPSGHPDLVLARAVEDQVLTASEAELIGATRLDHVPLNTWANAHGTARWATYKTRERAEKRLAGHLLDHREQNPNGAARKPRVSRSKTPRDPGVQECGTGPHDNRTSEVPPCA